jgi:hypothetical protein
MTRDYIESAYDSHYHVIATIVIRKSSVELIEAYLRDPVGCARGAILRRIELVKAEDRERKLGGELAFADRYEIRNCL